MERCIGLFLDLIPLSYSLCSSPQQIKKLSALFIQPKESVLLQGKLAEGVD